MKCLGLLWRTQAVCTLVQGPFSSWVPASTGAKGSLISWVLPFQGETKAQFWEGLRHRVQWNGVEM